MRLRQDDVTKGFRSALGAKSTAAYRGENCHPPGKRVAKLSVRTAEYPIERGEERADLASRSRRFRNALLLGRHNPSIIKKFNACFLKGVLNQSDC
jgi:hypothetical protein